MKALSRKGMKTSVVVAMSGGVDSSVAAALLKERGYEVIGITMCFGLKEAGKKKPSCCGLEGIEDARRVAHKLGIKHYLLNFHRALEEKVISNFLEEYIAGRTPNPCVRCNQYLKFDRLLKKTRGLGAAYLATGHYARISSGRNYLLNKAKDTNKDQSYFLYRLNQEQLGHILFPLGNYTKKEVRKLARRFGLPVSEKLGSQEICFIPDDDYRGFLRKRLAQMKKTLKPGPILDTKGDILGEHKGIPFYTIGQRQGLGIARGYPIYIIRIDVKTNSIIVGKREEALCAGIIAGSLSFTGAPIKRPVVLRVKIRYNHSEVPSRIIPLDKERLKVIFSKPQFAACPGQAAVFYHRQRVVGGGVIEEAINYAKNN